MTPRRKQQIGGLFIALAGGGFTAWSWYTAMCKGYYYQKASFIFPAFFVIGLGLVFFQGYKEERIQRGEDISQLRGLRLLTVKWRIILIVSFAAGALNFYMISTLH